jgi:hypothetical protein
MNATTDKRYILSKEDIANAIAAYMVTAPHGATAQDALASLIIALGINPSYVANLVGQLRRVR